MMKSILCGAVTILALAGACVAGTPDHPNAQLIAKFYAAFNAHDGKTMAASYTPDAHFGDEVFTDLNGPQVGGMWRMLTGQSKDLKVVASGIEADDTCGKAHWDAWYTFSTGRKVHNIVDAKFTFKNGLIATHKDSFDFYAWSKQALGAAGTLLGWTPFLKSQVRRTAARALAKFLEQNR